MSAVRCQRKAVMAKGPATTTARQTLGLPSTRAMRGRSTTARPQMPTPWASRAAVGGAMLETASPGNPTIDVG